MSESGLDLESECVLHEIDGRSRVFVIEMGNDLRHGGVLLSLSSSFTFTFFRFSVLHAAAGRCPTSFTWSTQEPTRRNPGGLVDPCAGSGIRQQARALLHDFPLHSA